MTQPGPSGVSRTANRNKDQIETSASVNFDKIVDNNASSSNKREDLYQNSTPGSSRKRNYVELFGDISDLLETNVSGIPMAIEIYNSIFFQYYIIRIILINFNFFN